MAPAWPLWLLGYLLAVVLLSTLAITAWRCIDGLAAWSGWAR